MNEARAEFFRFCMVGAVGFVVDAAITLALTRSGMLFPGAARVIAFVTAASVTWLLHRRFTFRAAGGAGGWAPYLALTALGGVLNVGAFLLWVRWWGTSSLQILIGVACGAALALVFNFAMSKHVVFKTGLRT